MVLFGSALLLGAVVVPLLIWVVGNRILGPYQHGTNPHAGPMALLGDFYDGLSRGWVSYWGIERCFVWFRWKRAAADLAR